MSIPISELLVEVTEGLVIVTVVEIVDFIVVVLNTASGVTSMVVVDFSTEVLSAMVFVV